MGAFSFLAILTIISILTSVSLTYSQQNDSSEKYLQDFDYFISILEETHPDPYSSFGGRIEFFRAKEKVRKSVKSVIDTYSFAALLNKFVSKLEDGHTSVYMPQISSDEKVLRLPLQMKVASDSLFIQNATEKYKHLIGSQIISINKVPLQVLVRKASELYPSENISGSYLQLIRLLRNNKSARELLPHNNQLEFQFMGNRKRQVVSIPFETTVTFPKSFTKIEIKNNTGLMDWDLIGRDKNIGYFVLNSMISREIAEETYQQNPNNIGGILNWIYSFYNGKRTGDVKKDIEQTPSLFEQFYLLLKSMKAKNTNRLIIDLRRNSGGTSIAEHLSYILLRDKYLNHKSDAEYIRRISPLFLQKVGYQNIDEYNNSEKQNYRINDYVFFKFGGLEENQTAQEKEKLMQLGRSGFGSEYIKKIVNEKLGEVEVVCLVSANTYSAGFQFAYVLKEIGDIKLIGVAPSQAGNSFIETTPFELPNTKLQGSISSSLQLLYSDNPKLGKLLKPDYEMTWNDYQKYGFDSNAEIFKAIEIFVKANKKKILSNS